MPRIIRLTLHNGDQIRLNADCIYTYQDFDPDRHSPLRDGCTYSGSRIEMAHGGHPLDVYETPERIDALIAAAK